MQGMFRLRPSAILLFLLPLLMPFAGGQSPLPSVEVTCQYSENPAKMDVSPTGSNYITASCTVENSSLGTEEITIDYDADGLNVVGPTELTLGGGESIDIQVAIAATEGLAPQSRNITVSAEVESSNSVPIPEMARPKDESNILVDVAAYSNLEMEISPNYLKMEAGGMPGSVTVLVRNNGNTADVYDLSVATSELTSRGFNVSITPVQGTASKGGSASFTVSLTPPDELSTESIQVKVTATSSEHGGTVSTSEIFTVNATAEDGGLLDFSSMNIPTWAWASGGILASLVVLAVIGTFMRKSRSSDRYQTDYSDDEDEDEDWDEDLDDLDDLDNLDDELDDLDMDLDDLDF